MESSELLPVYATFGSVGDHYGPSGPPTHLRTGDGVVFKVEWIRRIRPAQLDAAPSQAQLLSPVAIRGVVDGVRTALAELIASIVSGTPPDVDVPSRDVVDRAITIVINGGDPNVIVNSVDAGGVATNTVNLAVLEDSSGSSLTRKLATFIAGLASILGLLLAVAVWQGWL